MAETGYKRYFTGECARLLAEMVSQQGFALDADDYAAAVDARIAGLELKDRVLVLAEELRARLPQDYETAVDILVCSLGPELTEDQGMFTESWFLMPVARFVEEYGLEHPAVSLAAIEEITCRHTGEYAIRPYLSKWHDLTMAQVRRWARSDSHNVRRLATEGIRPRLPWAARYQPFVADPAPVIEILDLLVADRSGYVRTSVANNLNDISRDHPELAVRTARRWLDNFDSAATQSLVAKGLRTLVKAGNPAALETIGTPFDPHITVPEVLLSTSTPRVGDTMEILAMIANTSNEPRDVIVDYQIHFRKADGTLRPTVFRLGKTRIPAKTEIKLCKKHSFRINKTRAYHPGRQGISVQANGTKSEITYFTLW